MEIRKQRQERSRTEERTNEVGHVHHQRQRTTAPRSTGHPSRGRGGGRPWPPGFFGSSSFLRPGCPRAPLPSSRANRLVFSKGLKIPLLAATPAKRRTETAEQKERIPSLLALPPCNRLRCFCDSPFALMDNFRAHGKELRSATFLLLLRPQRRHALPALPRARPCMTSALP